MKIAAAIVLFLLGTLSVAAGDPLEVIEDVFSPEECKELRNKPSDLDLTLKTHHSGRHQGKVDLPLSFIRRLQEAPSNLFGSTDEVGGQETLTVTTSFITNSTNRHKDHTRDGVLVKEPVGFLFLNDNPDASFIHGTSPSVPVKAGTMVTFRGDVPHHTVVRNGIVRLLGPFAMSSFQPVGAPESTITSAGTTTMTTSMTSPGTVTPPCNPSFCQTCYYYCGVPDYVCGSSAETPNACIVDKYCEVCEVVCPPDGNCPIGCRTTEEDLVCPVPPTRRLGKERDAF